MNDLNLTELREIAEAATPGPWECGMTTFGDPQDGPTHACVRVEGAHWTDQLAVIEGSTEGDLNMAHIAAFDPPTVLALLDEIEELRAALVELAKNEGERPVKIVHEVAPKRYIVQRLSKEHEARPEWVNESGWNELHKAIEDAESWGEAIPDTPVRVIDAQAKEDEL